MQAKQKVSLPGISRP